MSDIVMRIPKAKLAIYCNIAELDVFLQTVIIANIKSIIISNFATKLKWHYSVNVGIGNISE